MIEIRHKDSGVVIRSIDADTLAGVDFREDSLAGADLRGQDLSGALLQGADFSDCDLREVSLVGAVRFHADQSTPVLSVACAARLEPSESTG